jgi:hypothetical protein
MNLSTYKTEILRTLRENAKSTVRDESAAWSAIEASTDLAANSPSSAVVETLVYSLALIYADQTGSLPGFSNSDNETRFERFAVSVVKRVVPTATRSQLKYAVRKIDPKHSARFMDDLRKVASGVEVFQTLSVQTRASDRCAKDFGT